MMPSVQAGNASLPSNKLFVPAQNRLPHRTSKALPKNRTGIYVESQQNGPEYFKHRTVPPLARPRGFVPTDYSTNYAKSKGRNLSKKSTNDDKLLTLSSTTLVSLYFCSSSTPPVCLPLPPPLFLRVPNVYPKQQQIVQNIRARQDWKGGFYPQPQKKSKNRHLIGRREQKPCPFLLNGVPDYQDLTRRSARNFVAACNNGVTHLEDLRSESISTFSVITTGESLQLEDIDDKSIAGLEEVYKKIVKEEGLTHLSTTKGRLTSGKNKSPLLIRSFRNPQNPHPVVQYSDVRQSRPSGKETYASRPPVPAPYFYNSRSLPKAADHGGSRVHLSRLPGSRSSDHILAAPGAGSLTKSALGFTREHSPPQGVEGQRPPALTSHRRLTESDERITLSDRFRVPSTTPATSTQDIQKALAEEEARENAKHVIIPDFCETNTDQLSNGRSSVRDHRNEDSSIVGVASGIMLSLETDEGISKAIDLEEEEERNRRDVLEYHAVQKALEESSKITVNDSAESEVDVSRESPTELDQLLHEHSEIVCQIHELEKLTCSDDEGDTN